MGLWCWFPGGWAYVCSRTSWASPTNSPVRLGVSATFTTPTEFYSQRFWGFLFPFWSPGLHSLYCSPVVHPSLSACKYGTSSRCLICPVLHPLPWYVSSLPPLPISTPPISLDECFFFNSLAARLSYSLIFWQSWLLLFLKLLLLFFWLCGESKHIYLCLYLGQKSHWVFLNYTSNRFYVTLILSLLLVLTMTQNQQTADVLQQLAHFDVLIVPKC